MGPIKRIIMFWGLYCDPRYGNYGLSSGFQQKYDFGQFLGSKQWDYHGGNCYHHLKAGYDIYKHTSSNYPNP